MKNQVLNNGNKLNKKQLRSITGGLINCMEPILCTDPPCDPPASLCTKFSPSCAQKECRP